jgi:hypothetical protein
MLAWRVAMPAAIAFGMLTAQRAQVASLSGPIMVVKNPPILAGSTSGWSGATRGWTSS